MRMSCSSCVSTCVRRRVWRHASIRVKMTRRDVFARVHTWHTCMQTRHGSITGTGTAAAPVLAPAPHRACLRPPARRPAGRPALSHHSRTQERAPGTGGGMVGSTTSCSFLSISASNTSSSLTGVNPWAITIIGISASPTACPLRGYGRAGTRK